MQKVEIFDYGFKDINPLQLGQEHCRSGKHYTSIRDHIHMYYIRSGKGIFIRNGKKYYAKKGDCLVTVPNETYSVIADAEDPWSYIWIGFSGEKSEHFNRLPAVFHYDGDLFYQMIATERIALLREYKLAALLLDLYRELFAGERLTPEQVVLHARGYIEKNYMHECKMEDIAKALNYSRSHLSKLYKRILGQSMKDYLIFVRMLAGYEYIEKGMTTVEAAPLCGYPDAPSFSRAFKVHFGFSVNDLQTRRRYMWDKFDKKAGEK